jgi:hypothetical protein
MFDLKRLFNAMSFRADPTADFRRMLEWKLLRGSHEFPGPDGGTCVNEAAMVAAGYPYHAVYSVKDLPGSFSRPIAMLALCLNDTLDDTLRQQLLMPFVMRLAGSADMAAIEMSRAQLILDRTISVILVPALMQAGKPELADQCRSLASAMDIIKIAGRLRTCSHAPLPRPLAGAFDHLASAATQSESGHPVEVVFCTFLAIRELALLANGDDEGQAYRRAAEILGAALAVGKHADMPLDEARSRMDIAKQETVAPRRRAGLLPASFS